MTTTITLPTAATIDAALQAAYAQGFVEGDAGKRWSTFPSGMSKEPGAALAAIVQAEGATSTLETGFALGLSTLWILRGVLGGVGEGRTPRHIAVDPYQSSDWKNAGRRLVESAGASGLVTHLAEDSTLALPRLVSEGRVFDLILVDGGHLHETAFCDIYFASRLTRPGGLVVVDDVWMPAVATAVSFFVANGLAARERRPDLDESHRFALLRMPAIPARRPWDHFVPFEVAVGKQKTN